MRPRARACFEAGLGALGDKLPFELGKRREDAEGEPAVGGGGVDLCAGAGQHFQSHAALAQVLGRVDQVLEVAPEPSSRHSTSVLPD